MQLFVSPADVGHTGISRSRTYIFCAHKNNCNYLFDLYEAYHRICRSLQRHIKTEPQDYFVASRTQVQSEAYRVAVARRKALQPETCSVQLVWVGPGAYSIVCQILSCLLWSLWWMFSSRKMAHRSVCHFGLQVWALFLWFGGSVWLRNGH